MAQEICTVKIAFDPTRALEWLRKNPCRARIPYWRCALGAHRARVRDIARDHAEAAADRARAAQVRRDHATAQVWWALSFRYSGLAEGFR